MCVPTINIGAPGAWHEIELSQNSNPAYSLPNLIFLKISNAEQLFGNLLKLSNFIF